MSFVASTTATRIWRVAKAAGRPWPVLCEDDVIDYMVMEAIAVKSAKDDEKAQEQAEKKDWKKDKEGLDNLRGAGG